MFRDLFQEISEVLIRLEIISPGSLGNTVDHSAGLGSPDGIDRVPVLLPLAEGPDAAFTALFIYQDNLRYAEDIFILIFCQGAHKHCI